MKLYRFRIRLVHDGGSLFINTIATGCEQAIEMVCKAEGCPYRAVTVIDQKPLKLN